MTKVAVVAPVDMGRGIKKNNTKKKYEVDLTDYVDGTSVRYTNGKLSTTGGGSADGNTTNQSIAVTDAGVLELTDTEGNKVQVTLPTLCDELKKLTKSTQAQGDYILALTSSGQCKLIPVPDTNAPVSMTCKIPWTATTRTSVVTKNQPNTITYKFDNQYDNEVVFTFEFSRSNTLAYNVTSLTKTAGNGTVVEQRDNDKGARVSIPAGGSVTFDVVVVPTQGGSYQFSVSGRTSISGGDNGSQNACGTGAVFMSVDDGS